MSRAAFRLRALAILTGAVAVQVAFMVHLGDRAYGDVLKAVNFGHLVEIGVYDVRRDLVNSKTFVAPWVDYQLFARFGLAGLHAANAVAFVALGVLTLALGRRRFDDATRLAALILFGFYVGTQRSVAAGELDDQIATVLIAAGVLFFLEADTVLGASVLIGLGFLFKFWAAIFGLGFLGFLLLTRRGWKIPVALLGLGLPFAGLTVLDGGGSVHALLTSIGASANYSTWSQVAIKCASTGLVPFGILAAAGWAEERRDVDALLLCVSSAYLLYVLAARDAWAASTMMMTCLVFSSLLIAAWLVRRASRLSAGVRRAAVLGLVLVYPAATTFVTALHLRRDTNRVWLVEPPAEAARLFRYNAPPPDRSP